MERTEPSRQGEASGRFGARRCVSWGALHPAILRLPSSCERSYCSRNTPPRPIFSMRCRTVGVASLPGRSPQTAAGLVNTIRTTGSIAMVVVTGWLIQRTTRRKAFLQVYAGLTAAAFLAPSLSATWTAMLIFAVLSGRPTAYSRRSISRSSLKCCRRAIPPAATSACSR